MHLAVMTDKSHNVRTVRVSIARVTLHLLDNRVLKTIWHSYQTSPHLIDPANVSAYPSPVHQCPL